MNCATESCTNTTNGRTHCSTCRVRKHRQDRPFRYHYQTLKDNAKRRGKHFDLSFEHFKEIWLRHPLKWEEKKKWGQECKWQVDRIKPWLGYVDGNIQILEKSKNVIKYQRHGKHQVEYYWKEKNGQSSLAETAPF